LSGLTVMYNGAPITESGIAALSNGKLSGLSYTLNGKTWSPLFYYRNDDPLRSSVATLLVSAAKLIGFTINAVGISDEEAGGTIYGSSEGDVITDGGYCVSGPNAGYDDCPAAAVNETASALAADSWDMYTFGWVTSSAFTFQGAYEWISSQVNNDNFNAFINSSMDFYGNQVLYAPTLSGAEAAAQKVGLIFAQSLPSVISFYENYLYADYVNGWTGYAGVATTGPNTGGGWYYTALNAHPTSGIGGTLQFGIHGIPDIGALNPIAYPNWVWQADEYDLIYDAPLNTPPAYFNVADAYIAWMTTGSDPTAPTGATGCVPAQGGAVPGCQVAPFSGMTPANSFAFQAVNKKGSGVGDQQKIVNGQAVTYTFDKNITFADNVPLTAYDFNYSLYALNVAISPDLPTAFSPFIGGVAGPLGLIASVVDNGGYSITMYMNTTSVWNVLDLDVPVLPMHVFNYLNINVADAVEAQIDFSQPYTVATGAVSGSTQGTAPASVTFLNTLNFASGPFWLQTINEATGSGILRAMTGYFRSSWYDNLANEGVSAKSGSITLTSYPSEYIYNPGSATNMSVAAGAVGWVNMTSANLQASNGGKASLSGMTCSATAYQYSGKPTSTNIFTGKATGTTVSLTPTCSGNGQIVLNITPSSAGLAKGVWEIAVTGTYTFLGEARTWYQYFGIYVH